MSKWLQYLSVLALMLGTQVSIAQTQYLMQNGSTSTCSGFFYDSGGPAGFNSGYQPNENFIYTFCPSGVSLMSITFSQFNLAAGDVLNVYNGNSAASPLMGSFDMNNPLLGTIQATVQNASGCLTFEFISDGVAESSGWAAELACVDPCQPFQALLTSVTPGFNNTGVEVDMCIGDTLFVEAIGDYLNNNFYYTQSDATSSFDWDWGDGLTTIGQQQTFHIYPDSGAFDVNLDIYDINGCDNGNVIDLTVRISTPPTLSVTAMEDTICFGETNDIAGSGSPNTWQQAWGNVLADTLQVPDNVGVPYQTTVTLNLFSPGQQLTNISDLLGICLNMEHSYLGDLNITIECPTGQTATLVSFPNGGGATFLGEPVDGDGANPIPAVGYDYCFVPTVNGPTYGTFSATSNTFFYNYTDVVGNTYTNHPYLPSGSYTSEDPLTQLLGCDLNGDWTITVVDNLGIDNGHIFSWYLDLNPALFPTPLIAFTPQIVSSTVNPLAPEFLTWTDSTATVQPLINGGTATYYYNVTDDFGCTYSDSVSFTVLPSSDPECFICFPPNMSGTDVTCNAAADGTITAVPSDSLGLSPPPFDFVWLGPTGAIVQQVNDLPGADVLNNIGPGTYTVIVTDSNGCVSTNDFTIVEPPPMVALIDSTADVTCKNGCNGYALLSIQGGSPPFNYHWSNNQFGLANASLCAGNNNVTVSDSYGCQEVLPFVTLEPDSVFIDGFGDTTVCIGGSATISAVANGGAGVPYDYVWNNLGFPSGITSQTIDPETPFIYEVYALDSNGCQSATVKIIVDIHDPISLLQDEPDTLCPGDAAVLGVVALGGDGNYQFLWSTGNTDSTITVSPDSSTTYFLTVSDGCTTPPMSTSLPVVVGHLPGTEYRTNRDTGCVPMNTNFIIDNHNPANLYVWNFGDQTSLTTRGRYTSHLYPYPGCYDISLNVTTPEGCKEEFHDICRLVVYPNPTADFLVTPDHITNIQSEALIHNQSYGAMEAEFDMGAGEFVYELDKFYYNFPDSGHFPITLTVWNEGGCIDTMTQVVFVDFETVFYVPNAFTPDGDGINDMWGPKGLGYQDHQYSMHIYNRWGELIFNTDDPAGKWDGRSRQGNFAPNGVYTYIIYYSDHLGTDPIPVSGHITLIR